MIAKMLELIEAKKARVRAKAEEMCAAIDQVAEMLKAEFDVEPLPSPKPKSNGKPARRQVKHRAKRQPIVRGGFSTSPKLLGAARKLPEPITMESLFATGLFKDKKQASNILTVWNGRGWITKAGRGEFTRTGSFGADPSAQSAALLEELRGNQEQGGE